MNTPQQVRELIKRDRIRVYVLAAPDEEDEYRSIRKHLTPAIRNSRVPIEIDSDYDIPAGEDVEKYKLRLFEADIVLAFISVDFIDDDEINERNKRVIERYNRNETILIPILVRNCQWTKTPFVNLQLLPKNLQPLNNKQYWNSSDDALMAVVDEIYRALEAFSNLEAGTEAPSVSQPQPPDPSTALNADAPTTARTVPPPIEPVAEGGRQFGSTPGSNGAYQGYQQYQNTNNPWQRAGNPINADWRKQYYRDVLWKRFLAFFLDQFLVLLPSFILFMFLLVPFLPEEELMDEQYELIGYAAFGFYFVICAIMESSRMRGTFGKRLLQLQITDKEGHSITFFRALWRNITRVIVGYLYVFVIPLVLQIYRFRKTKKLFHDQVSYTVIGERLRNR